MSTGKQAKRAREKKGKMLARARKVAAQGHLSIDGPVVQKECRLDLIVENPGAPAQRQMVSAIIDTGATACAIRADIAAKLGLPSIGKSKVHTPKGEMECEIVAGRIVIAGENKAFGSIVPIMVCQDLVNDMLFGMDAMEGGVLTVDLVRGTWQWKLMRVALSP